MTILEVQESVAREHGIDVETLIHDQSRDTVRIRDKAILRSRRTAPYPTLQMLAAAFGYADHTSVLTAIRREQKREKATKA